MCRCEPRAGTRKLGASRSYIAFPNPCLHSLLTAIAGKGEASPKEVLLMRAGTLAVVCILLTGSAAFAAEPMTPSDIQATFFNGEPFTASTPGGTKCLRRTAR